MDQSFTFLQIGEYRDMTIESVSKQIDKIELEFEDLYSEILEWFDRYDDKVAETAKLHNKLDELGTEYDFNRVDTPNFKEVSRRNLINF